MRDSEQGTGKRKRPRTCVGCGGEFPKNALTRIVRKPSGEVEADQTGRKPGRGVYICRKKDCVLRAKKRNLLSRSLKAPVPDRIYDTILSGLNDTETMPENDGGDVAGQD
ncbi:MAG: YlxR family protein [Thermovirgaceae bacterium]|nr:YlxR family protein [Thermovirgaceae bacterium]